MKSALLILLTLVSTNGLFAQDTVAIKARPDDYISTDLVYDVESIPTLGYEKFFLKSNNRLRSWHVEGAYQVHYSDQFGIVQSHGDRISVGVYQGPVARISKNIYSRKHRQHWLNYFTYGTSLKYLWYGRERVNTGKRQLDAGYRIQSEHCPAVVPQFAIGAKRTNKHFCADFYCGLQLPVKFRDKTIYQEQNSNGTINLQVPYTSNRMAVFPAPLVGIRLGYIK